MPGQERRSDRARRYARRGLISVGEDIRETRLRGGMTLRELSESVDISIAELSRIERGLSPHLAYETLALVGASVGLDIPIRAFPTGLPIRDAAQVELLRRLRAVLPRSLRMRLEVPLGIPGDLRAWDAAMDAPAWWRPVEAETRLRDSQALQRRIRLECRDGQAAQLVLVVADTRHNRRVLRAAADVLAEMFPVSSRDLIATLRAGQEPAGSGILLL